MLTKICMDNGNVYLLNKDAYSVIMKGLQDGEKFCTFDCDQETFTLVLAHISEVKIVKEPS
ncbi:hypothetical protein [Plectonema phage Pbo-yong3]|uniref:hypothetical protein n=1 Tax=Plectonema phage Pbo-yong3 TaxID=2970324 RepID=UPI00403CE60E|nr:hypothetical protein [Plectonema phage Pbo-yong3]